MKGNRTSFFDPGEDGVKKSQFFRTWRALFSTDSCFYLSYPYCDTIYSISLDLSKITPSYYIDYTPKKLPDIPIEPTDDVISWKKSSAIWVII